VRQFNNFLNSRTANPKPQRPRDIGVATNTPASPIRPHTGAHLLYSKFSSNPHSHLDSPIQFKTPKTPSRTFYSNSIALNPNTTSTDSFNTPSLTGSKTYQPYPHSKTPTIPNPLTLTTSKIARNYMGSNPDSNPSVKPQNLHFGVNSDRAYNASKKNR
jgi:hypothetical protein